MADNVPHKGDIMAIFKRLRAIPTNKVCFDCSCKNPTWASVTYGVFLCIDCSAVHRGLGVHVTFVRSTQLDTNWTWLQLRNMQLGGNANARKFFHQHNCSTTDAQQKYHSRAAQLYRDKLHGMAVQAMKLYGTQVHIESEHHDGGGEKAQPDVDFFDEHSSAQFEQPPAQDNKYSAAAQLSAHEPEPEPQSGAPASNGAVQVPGAGPRVEHVLGTSPQAAPQQIRKSTIGQRRPAGGKLGARKLGGGLGAQKVKKDFSEIERQAEQADMMKVQAAEAKKEEARQTAEEQERQLASVRLAYQDLSLEQRKQTDRVKNMDPKKAEQLERLGMGFGGGNSGAVSHSAFSDMETIEQSAPASAEPLGRRGADAFSRRDDMDEFELGFSSKAKSQSDDDDFFGGFSSGTGLGGLGSSSGGGWGKSSSSASSWEKAPTSSWEKAPTSSWEKAPTSSWDKTPSSAPRRPPPTDTSKTSCGDDAQKKFGNAKAISSAAYFGDERPSFESQQNMNRFQGARGISSADYFGEPQTNRGGGGGPMMQTPDLEDVKESVRQGVTKVAGKLGTLANGVMSSLQDRSWN
ncbi:ADP-ribosylation factor GTPase-activating protein 2-like isoform X1 [Amphibalanus amphitrite]|uniref:ADP-ribosylation factor GTPase-activating protein 2-like isoform X1 n=2 Tax=Amphibalanus amphitrite TaxID=1232801 RepID=UPI001C920C88|nr:ADP-ribosylation factor GTPase-activating protein 2-like isoform X1 [Amphibalanus amphitrite]